MTTDDEEDRHTDEADAQPEHVDREHADEQDFAIRNVAMSNALPNSPQPAAGAVVGFEPRLGMQPETDEEIIDEAEQAANPEVTSR